MAQQVVSRHFAYATAFEGRPSIDLCKLHDTDEAAGRPLGEISHGRHWGICDVCHPQPRPRTCFDCSTVIETGERCDDCNAMAG